jgi:Signal transduction histidine kinase regulating C4-dicarboxylate transport system
MYSRQVEELLEQLIVAAEKLSMGRYEGHEQIFAMTDDGRYPPVVARFAEAFGMMAVKIEAREFRLEQMIDDLTRTRDELTVTNQRLQQSLQELQQAQMQLIQQAKMETVGRLAAGVAHEVKNPLAIIQLGTDFLADQLKDTPALV